MGIESYSTLVLFQNVTTMTNNGNWKIVGKSKYYTNKLTDILKSMQMENTYDNDWIYDKSIEIKIYEEDNCIQGIEIRGCFSYLEEGIENCYTIIKNIKKVINQLNIYILNEKVCIENKYELESLICEKYKGKIEIFKKQYNNIRLKVTCGEFYYEIYENRKWHRKLYKRIKNIFYKKDV